MENILAFLSLLLPLTLSPGPATIALSGLAMNKGIIHSLPFYFGLLFSSVIIVIASGMGLNEILFSNPIIYKVIHYVGILYIFYLSYKFFRINSKLNLPTKNKYNIYDGMLLNTLNPKFYLMVTIIFSQFLNPEQKFLWLLIIGMILVMAFSLLIWLFFGASLKSLLKSEKAIRIQSRIFGLLMFLVALFILLKDI